jgi:WD40 repeat protein
VNAVAFSPDGRTIAVGNDALNMGLWNTSTGRETASLFEPDADALAFSPDGKTLAAGNSGGQVFL